MKKSAAIIIITIILAISLVSCINTQSPDARVTLFLTMVKSGNFADAKSYIDEAPFTQSVTKKINSLPDAAIINILKNSNIPNMAKETFDTSDEVKMAELKKTIRSLMLNDPNIVEMTLREMSGHIQNKDIDVIAQKINSDTGEVHIRFSEAQKHNETVIFYISKTNGLWRIGSMEDIVTGWLF